MLIAMAGCPSTVFIKEGPGQPTDEASGRAPSGTMGACRVAFSERPPVISKSLWENLSRCTPRTPERYLRIGYGRDAEGRRVELATRVERATGRTFPCDYTYLLNTTDKMYSKLAAGDKCPAYAYDPDKKGNACLFDTSVGESTWLTSAWSCLAFTDTVGEGQSCYRLCEYDDYCAAQVSCAAPDFDLVLCALGVCTPDTKLGVY
jgi:hypothetical protein